MKKIKRSLQRVTVFALVFSMLFIAIGGTKKVNAATTNQLNIVARADYMYNTTWTCKKTISGWNYRYTFYAGNTYHLPYAWPVHAGAYIGYGVSVDNFVKAAANANSSFYKYRSYVSGVGYSYSTYYGSDCSSFVSWCWGIKRNTTYTIPNYSRYIGGVSTNNARYALQLGDALNSRDHVVLVTDLVYNSRGAITMIEITEQTPPQMKRSYYTPEALSAKYGGSYSIYRYYGNVPAAPGGSATVAPAPSIPALPGKADIGSSFTATISNTNADKNIGVDSTGNVVLMDKKSDPAQQWTFTRRSNGSYEIKNVKTGKCLDVNASKSTAGANVQVWDDYDNNAQSWNLYYVDSQYVFKPLCSSECVLDVAGAGVKAGTNVATWTYNAGVAQKFTISHVIPNTPVNLGESFTAKITNASSGKNLSIYEPRNVILYHDSTSPAQQWNFVRQSDGSYKITNNKYGTCLDVNGASSRQGTNVQLWEDLNNSAQRWFIYSVGDKYIFRPACSFDCVLDVTGAASADNTNIQTWSYNSGNAQLFTIKKLSGVKGYNAGYVGGMKGDGKIYAHGLDLSSWQGSKVNFNAIKNAGYSYVILRAGTTKGKDTCFETLYANAKAAGLNVGAYYYSYATTVDAAKKDAQNMVDWIKGKTFEYPIYFDYEDPSQKKLSSTLSKDICLAFMDRLASEGYLTGMYTGYYMSTTLPMSEICSKYEVWIANYYDYTYQTLSKSYSSRYGMYQYTDRNYVNGAGPYDANVAFKDYPSIVKKYGFNGYGSTIVAENPILPDKCVNLGEDFYATITNVGADKNLSIYEPRNVIIYQKSQSDAQKWHFVRQSDGSYEITNVKYNKCLDVNGAVDKAGTNVQLWDDLDNSAQRWFIYEENGNYIFRPACSKDCVLDVAGSQTVNEANVQIWTYNACNAQKFKINQILPNEIVDLGDKFVAKITNVSSGKNLSIYEPSNVIQYHNSTSPAQQWEFVKQSDGSYMIKNLKYGKYLDVNGAVDKAGTNVQIWENCGSNAQKWFIYKVNNGYALRPACSTGCVLDVYDASHEDNANVQIWGYHSGAAQIFDIRKISADDYADIGTNFTATITNVNADKNLTYTSDNNVVIQTKNTSDSQKWEFVRQDDGSYIIRNTVKNKCLDVNGGSAKAGTNVQLWDEIYSDAQRWYIYALDDGKYVFRPACATDSVLDVAGSGTADNTNVATWTYLGGDAQIFTITRTIPAKAENLGDSFVAKITNAGSNKNLSIYEPSNVILYHNSTSPAQDWKFERQSDNSYIITNVKYNKCLDVAWASPDSDANVQIWERLNNTAQRWYIYKYGDSYLLRPACSTTCVLDVDGGSSADETNIQTWTFNGSNAQLFKVTKK